jgi:hypothetical protein
MCYYCIKMEVVDAHAGVIFPLKAIERPSLTYCIIVYSRKPRQVTRHRKTEKQPKRKDPNPAAALVSSSLIYWSALYHSTPSSLVTDGYATISGGNIKVLQALEAPEDPLQPLSRLLQLLGLYLHYLLDCPPE